MTSAASTRKVPHEKLQQLNRNYASLNLLSHTLSDNKCVEMEVREENKLTVGGKNMEEPTMTHSSNGT